MFSFGPSDFHKNFFKVIGFDQYGTPKIIEVSFDGSKSKQKILHIAVETQDQMKMAVKSLADYDGLSVYLDIEIDLEWILPFSDKIMYIEYQGKVKNLEFISQFSQLRYLRLKECRKPLDLRKLTKLIELVVTKFDFSGFNFSSLANIRHFRFINCQNLSSIPINKNTPLQYLSLLWDRDTKSFDFLKEAANLEIIGLMDVSKLEHWPDSKQMTRLRRIYFNNTNRLFDYSGLAKAPNLECVQFGTKGLKPAHLEPFMQCKSLKYLGYFGTKKDTALVREMFPGVLLDHDRPEDCSSVSIFFNEDDWVMR